MSSRHEYELFYQTDMLFRHKMNYPPFSYMSSITILCEKADQACIIADKIFEELKQYKDFELLGPALPYLYKENNKIRMKILIKSKKHDLINQALQNINNKFANEAKERKCSIVFDIDTYTTYDEMKLDRLSQHTRGFVKIQDGCENFCSYCLIPYARGKIKSRDPQNVIDEINTLVNLGTKEIIIAGINTGTYGQDLGNINLAKLIELIMDKTSLYRLRLSSIELMEVSDELLNVMKKHENRIANHLHIPLQGGCDNTLTRMKRKYNSAEYDNLINKIRTIFPDIAITTDCLCGFVGETEKDFNDSIEFIKKIKFSSMHVFPYSRRKGTVADEMTGHLDGGLIKERARIMIDVASQMKKEYEDKFINYEFEVLFEQKKGNTWIGHTTNYLEVYLESEEDLTNQIKICKIIKMKNNKLFAEEVK